MQNSIAYVPGLATPTLQGLQTAANFTKQAHVYDVISDGLAKANTKTVADGVLTLNSAVVTSATATWSAADQGKVFVAASGSNILSTTILSFQSANQVTLAANWTHTGATGSTFAWGTDDTAAINAGLTALTNGTVSSVNFPAGNYMTSGGHLLTALQLFRISGFGATLTYSGTGATTALLELRSCRYYRVEGLTFSFPCGGIGSGLLIRRPTNLDAGYECDQITLADLWALGANLGFEIGRAGEGQTSTIALLNCVSLNHTGAGFQQDGISTEGIVYYHCESAGVAGSTNFNLNNLSATLIHPIIVGNAAVHVNVGGTFRNLKLIQPHIEMKATGSLFLQTNAAGSNQIVFEGGSISNFAVTTGNNIANAAAGGFLVLQDSIIFNNVSGTVHVNLRNSDSGLTFIKRGTGAWTGVDVTGGGGTFAMSPLIGGDGGANQLGVYGAPTATNVHLEASGTDTNINVEIKGKGTGNVIVGPNMRNYPQVGAATNQFSLTAVGTDTNVDVALVPKGTGMVSSTTGFYYHINGGAAPDPGNGGTVATAGLGGSRVNPAAARTGVILAAGTQNGQEVVVYNEAAAGSGFSITFAADATSNVAGGTGIVIAANAASKFSWNFGTSRWYPCK